MQDSQTTVMDLRKLIERFVQQREWQTFHSPKNLAMSMAIESAELMEHFQWLTVEQSRAVVDDPRKMTAIGEELADVLCYALAMANALKLDIATVVHDKMSKNEQKYPPEEFRGRYGKEDIDRAG